MTMMCNEHPSVESGGEVAEFRRELDCAARFDMAVLITGDDGDDNRAVAEAIHRRSRRAGAPFLAIDCVDMSEPELESTLFGCAYGGADSAGTRGCLERGHGGTVFVANVDVMSGKLQALLMQFLENGEIRRVGEDRVHRKVDVRVMTSAEWGPFARPSHLRVRADLFYRLNVMHLAMATFRRLPEAVPHGWAKR
jgi:DNA-binding NtrC family response regulator